MGRAGPVRRRSPLPRGRHARRHGRDTDDELHLGGLRRHRRRRPLHHHLVVRPRNRQPRRPAPGRRTSVAALGLPGDPHRGTPASRPPSPERYVGPPRPEKGDTHDRANGPLRRLWRSHQPPAHASSCPTGRRGAPATEVHGARLGQHRLVNENFCSAHRRWPAQTRSRTWHRPPATPWSRMLSFQAADVTQPAEVSQLIGADHPDTLFYLALPPAVPVSTPGIGGSRTRRPGRGGIERPF